MASRKHGQLTGDGGRRPHKTSIINDPSNETLQLCLSTTAAVVDFVPGLQALSGISKQKRLLAFLALNFVFMIVEFVYGYMNNSLGMLSDAAHMLLDNVAVAIGLAAEYYAAKCKLSGAICDPVRIRLLAGFANAVILMFVALNIVLEAAVHVIGAGHDVTTHRLLPVSVAGLVVNLMGLVFVHEAHHHGIPTDVLDEVHHGSHATGSSCACMKGDGSGAGDPNMRAILLHIMADTLGSLAVIMSTLAMQTFDWHWADPVASVTIASLIVVAVWPLVKHSAVLLLEAPPPPPAAAVTEATGTPPQIEAALRNIDRVPGVSALKRHYCMQVAAGGHVVAIQLEVLQGSSAAAAEDVAQQARLLLHRSGSVSECYVQTACSETIENGTASSWQSRPEVDDATEISAVHSSLPAGSYQATERTKSASTDVTSALIHRSSRKAPCLPSGLRQQSVH